MAYGRRVAGERRAAGGTPRDGAGAKRRRVPGTEELRLRAALASREEELRLTRADLLTAEADALRAHAKLEESGGAGRPDWTFRTPAGMVTVRFRGPGRPAGVGPAATLDRGAWSALFRCLAQAARAEAARLAGETGAAGRAAAEQATGGGERWRNGTGAAEG